MNTTLLAVSGEPTVVEPGPLDVIFSGPIGLVIVGVLACAAAGVLIVFLIEMLLKEKKQLSQALRPYSDTPEEKRDFSKLADTEFIKKAVASTARIAQERGLLEKVNKRLEQAALPLRPAEALFFTGVVALVAMVIGGILLGILGVFLGGMLFAFLPFAITGILAAKRRRAFTSQLPDTLQLLAGSLRAGYSLVQGLDAVAKQVEEPMAGELQRAMSEARLGRPVELALEDIADRMGSEDFDWAVMAIKIQREVGGNLAELLMTVSDTMVQRERLRREVRALTAEGRISAIVLSALPPVMGLAIAVLNPVYMEPLLGTLLGQIALIVAGVMIVVGYLAMNKLTQIEA
jgi:tight adherence protein B